MDGTCSSSLMCTDVERTLAPSTRKRKSERPWHRLSVWVCRHEVLVGMYRTLAEMHPCVCQDMSLYMLRLVS